MSGYTPAFNSMYTGSLHGRWPTAVVWASLLPLADARGYIDMSFQAIASITGWPLELLRLGIAELEMPDPDSRSPAEGGRRLVRLDPSRSWGWRVVNHQLYKERARDKQRTADGRNAQKVREWRERQKTPDDTECNPELPVVTPGTLSDSDSDSDKKKDNKTDVELVFDHWKEVHSHPKAKLDEKRRKCISAALKLHGLEDLQRCISGYKNSAFHMGKNDRNEVYDDICTFLRESKQVERGLTLFDNPRAKIEWER